MRMMREPAADLTVQLVCLSKSSMAPPGIGRRFKTPGKTMSADWIAELPVLQPLDAATREVLRKSAVRVTLPRGSAVFRPGDACGRFPLVASGSIRVQRVTESGREIVLYRVTSNETCILTIACLMSDEAYAAEAVAETDVVAYVLPSAPFKTLMNQSATFREIVFSGYSQRIATLMSLIEEIVCTRIDIRLAERLLALRSETNRIETTQHALAADLGTAREVIGRALKSFERAGWVSLSRGAIRIVNKAALVSIIESDSD
jgi:CRP/FNR family transcriptional regulator